LNIFSEDQGKFPFESCQLLGAYDTLNHANHQGILISIRNSHFEPFSLWERLSSREKSWQDATHTAFWDKI